MRERLKKDAGEAKHDGEPIQEGMLSSVVFFQQALESRESDRNARALERLLQHARKLGEEGK